MECDEIGDKMSKKKTIVLKDNDIVRSKDIVHSSHEFFASLIDFYAPDLIGNTVKCAKCKNGEIESVLREVKKRSNKKIAKKIEKLSERLIGTSVTVKNRCIAYPDCDGEIANIIICGGKVRVLVSLENSNYYRYGISDLIFHEEEEK